MPVTAGRYADSVQNNRWFWVRHHLAGLLQPRRDPRDNGGGFTMHREWGAWVLRPVTGWRSIRWVTPPVRMTRSVSADDRGAALDWHAQALGI